MSRSWVERWRIGLAPEAVELLRWPWIGTRPAAEWRQDGETPSSAARPWQGAVQALQALLEQAGATTSTAGIVLSNHFVRYLALPWQPEVTQPQELREVAQARLQQVYGSVASGWTVRCSEAGWGRGSVVCAVDSELLQALDQTLRARRLHALSVQPLLMAAFNGMRRSLAADSVLAVLEPGRLCVAVCQGGALTGIASRRLGDEPQLDVAELVEQELALMGIDEPPEAVDLLRVGPCATWPSAARRGARAVGGERAQGRSLALCGVS